MRMIDKEILEKFFDRPGLCSLNELEEVRVFLERFKLYRDRYIDAVGYLPQGLTLEGNLDQVNWYIDFQKNTNKYSE